MCLLQKLDQTLAIGGTSKGISQSGAEKYGWLGSKGFCLQKCHFLFLKNWIITNFCLSKPFYKELC